MSTHPSEANEALDRANTKCRRLIEDAEKRGDQAGADAWLVALRSIESAEKTMRDAREAQTWRDSPPASPLIMPCGCPFGSHPAKPNYLQGAAEREGPVCDLGWPQALQESTKASLASLADSDVAKLQSDAASAVDRYAAGQAERDSSDEDQRHAVGIAKRIVGRSGSRWHDIDQRLARSVIRTCNDLRVVTRERTAERGMANELLTQLHDERKAHQKTIRDCNSTIANLRLARAAGGGGRMVRMTSRPWDPSVVIGPSNIKIIDGAIDGRYLIVNPRQARWIAAQLQAGADKLDPPAGDRCHLCDRQLATRDDYESHHENCEHCSTLCWSEYHSGCVAPPVDWRARALSAEAHLGSGITGSAKT